MEKYHKQDVAPIEKENERDENYEAANPQIDSERTRNNYRFTLYFGKTYTEFINGRIKELSLSPRKDAVVMNSFVLGSDKTFFDGLANEKYVHAGKTLARIAPNTYRGITYGMSSVGLFFSAFADFCTPSVQSQIPLLQKIEQEMQEEKERYEWLNRKNGAHK